MRQLQSCNKGTFQWSLGWQDVGPSWKNSHRGKNRHSDLFSKWKCLNLSKIRMQRHKLIYLFFFFFYLKNLQYCSNNNLIFVSLISDDNSKQECEGAGCRLLGKTNFVSFEQKHRWRQMDFKLWTQIAAVYACCSPSVLIQELFTCCTAYQCDVFRLETLRIQFCTGNTVHLNPISCQYPHTMVQCWVCIKYCETAHLCFKLNANLLSFHNIV